MPKTSGNDPQASAKRILQPILPAGFLTQFNTMPTEDSENKVSVPLARERGRSPRVIASIIPPWPWDTPQHNIPLLLVFSPWLIDAHFQEDAPIALEKFCTGRDTTLFAGMIVIAPDLLPLLHRHGRPGSRYCRSSADLLLTE